ncbi:MAG: hypothetical protein QOH49_839 [Acidobacteriota bacterium]|nr:hypothetical protein [Acidobacteriota bacterium]
MCRAPVYFLILFHSRVTSTHSTRNATPGAIAHSLCRPCRLRTQPIKAGTQIVIPIIITPSLPRVPTQPTNTNAMSPMIIKPVIMFIPSPFF